MRPGAAGGRQMAGREGERGRPPSPLCLGKFFPPRLPLSSLLGVAARISFGSETIFTIQKCYKICYYNEI